MDCKSSIVFSFTNLKTIELGFFFVVLLSSVSHFRVVLHILFCMQFLLWDYVMDFVAGERIRLSWVLTPVLRLFFHVERSCEENLLRVSSIKALEASPPK